MVDSMSYCRSGSDGSTAAIADAREGAMGCGRKLPFRASLTAVLDTFRLLHTGTRT